MSRLEADWNMKRIVAETEFRGKELAVEEFIYEDRPNFPPAVQDFEKIEQTEPLVLLEPMIEKCPRSKNKEEVLEVWQLKFRSSKFIERVITRIINSTNYVDKSALIVVRKVNEQK